MNKCSIKHLLGGTDYSDSSRNSIIDIVKAVSNTVIEGIKKFINDDINKKHLELFKNNLNHFNIDDSKTNTWFPIMGEVAYVDFWKYYLQERTNLPADNIKITIGDGPLLMPFVAYAVAVLFTGERNSGTFPKLELDIVQNYGRTVMTVVWSASFPVVRSVKDIIDDTGSSFEVQKLAGRLLFLNTIFPNIGKSNGFTFDAVKGKQSFSLCL